jgi:hypothetical protein
MTKTVLQQAACDQPPATERTAFEIGWDFAHYRLTPPADHLHQGNPVRQGWEAGQAVFGQRTLRATVFVRKWLQLRLGAWLRGKAFEGVTVTPNFLAQIDVALCPITGETLTHATGLPSDASVDRVNNQAGYAAGNLAVMSHRANQAKSQYDWRDAASFTRQIERGELGRIDGLDATAWARLTVLMSFATPLSHAEAAHLPLLLLPPARLRVLNPAQAMQVMLTMRFTRPGQAPQLDQLSDLFPAAVRPEFHSFMTTLLARRIAAGPQQDGTAMRDAMLTAWTHPLVLRRWQRLVLRLTAACCERIVDLAVARGLAGGGLRCLSPALATEGWALATGGRVAADEAMVTWSLLTDAAGSPMRRAAAITTPLRPRDSAQLPGSRVNPLC